MPTRAPRRGSSVNQLDERARKRIRLWMQAKKVTQAELGKAAGHDQPWASQYLAGDMNAGLSELAGMAEKLGQPITALFDAPAAASEAELLERFRGCDEHGQGLLLEFARRLAPDPTSGRRGPRAWR